MPTPPPLASSPAAKPLTDEQLDYLLGLARDLGRAEARFDAAFEAHAETRLGTPKRMAAARRLQTARKDRSRAQDALDAARRTVRP